MPSGCIEIEQSAARSTQHAALGVSLRLWLLQERGGLGLYGILLTQELCTPRAPSPQDPTGAVKLAAYQEICERIVSGLIWGVPI